MKNIVLALENQEEPIVDDNLADNMAGFEQGSAELLEEADRLDEAQGLVDVLDVTAQSVEKAADDETVSDELVVATEAFLQHAAARLGAKRPVRIGIESNDSADTKKQKLKRASAEIATLRTKAEESLSIAQEGFGEKLADSLSLLFKSDAGVLARLNEANSASNQAPGNGGEKLTGSWVKNLGSASGQVNGKAAIATAKRFTSELGKAHLKSNLKELAALVRKHTGEVRSLWFYSNQHDVARIESITSNINALLTDKAAGLVTVSHGNSDATAIALSQHDAAELCTATTEAFKAGDYESAMNELFSADERSKFWGLINLGFRLKAMAVSGASAGLLGHVSNFLTISSSNAEEVKKAREALLPEDIAKARNAASSARTMAENLYNTGRARLRFGHAVTQYVEKSTLSRRK